MRTGVKVFLIILGLIISAGIVVGVDAYLSYKGIMENVDDFTMGTPTYILSSNNETVTVSSLVTGPKIGYLPVKSVLIIITIEKGGIEYAPPINVTLKLGTSVDFSFAITLQPAEVFTISTGGSFQVTVDARITPIYFGIKLEDYSMYLSTQTITVSV